MFSVSQLSHVFTQLSRGFYPVESGFYPVELGFYPVVLFEIGFVSKSFPLSMGLLEVCVVLFLVFFLKVLVAFV